MPMFVQWSHPSRIILSVRLRRQATSLSKHQVSTYCLGHSCSKNLPTNCRQKIVGTGVFGGYGLGRPRPILDTKWALA
jgi:hypothetical protein